MILFGNLKTWFSENQRGSLQITSVANPWISQCQGRKLGLHQNIQVTKLSASVSPFNMGTWNPWPFYFTEPRWNERGAWCTAKGVPTNFAHTHTPKTPQQSKVNVFIPPLGNTSILIPNLEANLKPDLRSSHGGHMEKNLPPSLY